MLSLNFNPSHAFLQASFETTLKLYYFSLLSSILTAFRFVSNQFVSCSKIYHNIGSCQSEQLSSIGGGDSSALFQSMAKIRTQEYERKITSTKIRAHNLSTILRMQNSKFYILEISWKPHDGNFLETICWEISCKLYAGKFFGNYMLVTS